MASPFQLLQNLGRSGDDLNKVVRTFFGSARSGLLGPDIQRYVQTGLSKPPAKPTQFLKGAQANQLLLETRIPKGQAGAGQIRARVPQTVRTGSPDVVRASLQPTAADAEKLERTLRAVRPAEVAPGQLNLFERGAAPAPSFSTRSPESLSAAEQLQVKDPGTFRSLSELADRASQTLGARITVEDLMAPDWSQRISRLEPGALVRSPGGGMTPPGGSSQGLAPYARGGELGSRTSGALARQDVPEEIIEAQIREIQFPRGIGAGAQDAVSDGSEFAGGMGSMAQDLRNAAGGLRRMNLGQAVAAGGLTGLGGAFLAGQLFGGRNPGEPTQAADPASTALPPTPPSNQNVGALGIPGNTIVQAAGAALPSAGQPAPGVMGGGQVVIRTDDGASELRQAVQRAKAGSGMAFAPDSPAAYKQIADYYAARGRYASQPQAAEGVRTQLTERGSLGTPDLVKWAESNPALAYELLQREAGQRQLTMNANKPISQGVSLGSELGSNNMNNTQGFAQSSAVSSVYGNQGASDLADATKPLSKPVLLSPQDYEALRSLRGGFPR
jgi:hypothetical protein